MWRELPDRADLALKSYDKTWCIHNTSRLASPTLMKLEDTKASIRLIAGITCIALFASCATAPQTVAGSRICADRKPHARGTLRKCPS